MDGTANLVSATNSTPDCAPAMDRREETLFAPSIMGFPNRGTGHAEGAGDLTEDSPVRAGLLASYPIGDVSHRGSAGTLVTSMDDSSLTSSDSPADSIISLTWPFTTGRLDPKISWLLKGLKAAVPIDDFSVGRFRASMGWSPGRSSSTFPKQHTGDFSGILKIGAIRTIRDLTGSEPIWFAALIAF